jgi:regulator of protease activity HflC (stomatin/prohibitin superfamily)
MISPERLLKALWGFFKLVGLPLLVSGILALLVELRRLSGPMDFTLHLLGDMLPITMGLMAVAFLSTLYLDTLYGLGGLIAAHNRLFLNAFGQIGADPWIVVSEGRITGNVDSHLVSIGGPGLVITYNDSAIVTEQEGRLKRVLGPGYNRLERFERIWEIVDLRPQHWVYSVSALTRDGIPISCDADITFKIDDRAHGIPLQPTEKIPHPFTKEAVFKAATATWVREEEREDQYMKWTGRVIISNTEGALRGILAQYRLDEMVNPEAGKGSNTTRETIRCQLEEALQESAPQVGARIINVDIGKIDVTVDLPEGEEEAAADLTDEVLNQWIETWQAELERDALAEQGQGEAEMVRLEAISVQAQAEMILTLIEAVQPLISSEDVSSYRTALRFVETLRWMAFDPEKRAFMPLEPLRSLQNLEEIVRKSDPLAKPQPTSDEEKANQEESS